MSALDGSDGPLKLTTTASSSETGPLFLSVARGFTFPIVAVKVMGAAATPSVAVTDTLTL